MATNYRNNLSEMMKKAWMLVKRFGYTISEAMKQAWALNKLVKRMHNGIVQFFYKKMDGTTRQAWGTLNAALMPAGEKKSNRKPNDSVQVYYDTDKQEFRCFKIANLMIR